MFRGYNIGTEVQSGEVGWTWDLGDKIQTEVCGLGELWKETEEMTTTTAIVFSNYQLYVPLANPSSSV